MSGKPKFWTPARIADLKAYAKQGLTAPEAGAKFNKTTMAIHWQAHRLEIKFTPVKPGWTEQEDAILRTMVAAGSGWKEVGRVLDKSKSGVRGYAIRNGIELVGKKEIQKREYRYARPLEKKCTRARRKCLTCGETFQSKWIGNRICKPCTSGRRYQTEGSAFA